ncbi:MAG: polysaccharide pyruvyl transferase family protein [Oscillospiraceae bacterium]|nr:polysaccharide pyruvyl transferase family protein [Oscillospiraceae bacterium]
MRIAMYFHAGCLNRGNEAIVRGTLPMLREAFGAAELTLLTSKIEEDLAARLPEDLRVRQLYPTEMKGISRFSPDYLRLWYYRLKSTEKADELFFYQMFKDSDAAGYDLYLSVGGDNYCYGALSDIAALNRILLERGRPAVLWGCSVEEEKLTPQKREDLRRYSLITAREHRSLALLNDLGLGERSFYHPDPAFLMEAKPRALPEGFVPGQTIGLNLSRFVTQDNPGCAAALRALLPLLLRESGGSVALVPHVLRPGWNDDRDALRDLLEEFGEDPRLIPVGFEAPWSAEELKHLISQCRCFIGARTHAVIAAYSTGVPALALGYSVKAYGLAEDLFGSADGLVLSREDFGGEGVCHMAEAFFERENELRRTLSDKLPRVKQGARAAAERLKTLI